VRRAARWVNCARTYSRCRHLRHLLREGLELPVQHLPSLPFLLLKFDFVFISVAVLALPVARFIELNIRCLAVELHILSVLQYKTGRDSKTKGTYVRLPFSDHHRRLQMYVNNHEQFVVAGLEEKMLDVAEKDIWDFMSTAG
jgi:hypothetical protein